MSAIPAIVTPLDDPMGLDIDRMIAGWANKGCILVRLAKMEVSQKLI
jgi:hypothetical protein